MKRFELIRRFLRLSRYISFKLMPEITLKIEFKRNAGYRWI